MPLSPLRKEIKQKIREKKLKLGRKGENQEEKAKASNFFPLYLCGQGWSGYASVYGNQWHHQHQFFWGGEEGGKRTFFWGEAEPHFWQDSQESILAIILLTSDVRINFFHWVIQLMEQFQWNLIVASWEESKSWEVFKNVCEACRNLVFWCWNCQSWSNFNTLENI